MDWQPLASTIAGEVALPGSPSYEAAYRAFNARYRDARPLAVVSCAGPEDVAEALSFVRRGGFEVAIRGGGHSFGGQSSTRGVLIDLAPMSAVSVSGGVASTGAGARLGEVYEALEAHRVTIPGGTCPSVGVSGLTLGGGLGILGRTYGVTSDRLVGAEVVLADGRIVACDAHREEDLFWALRGAGAGTFGVVTKLVFDPVPMPEVTNAHLAWADTDAGAVIDAWQHWAPAAPDQLAASLKITAGEDVDRPPAVDVYAAYLGPESDAEPLVGELVDRVGSDPASATLTWMTYPQTRAFWAELGATDAVSTEPSVPEPASDRCFYAKSEFFSRTLLDEAIGALLAAFLEDRAPGEARELDFMPWGGAYTRTPADATAFVHRDQLFQLKHAITVDAEAPASSQAAAHRAVGRSWASVHPWGSGTVFPNFADPDLPDPGSAYFGTNLPRLLRIKEGYDPSGFFPMPATRERQVT